MEYCNIGPLGGRYFAQLLSFSGSALEKLCLLVCMLTFSCRVNERLPGDKDFFPCVVRMFAGKFHQKQGSQSDRASPETQPATTISRCFRQWHWRGQRLVTAHSSIIQLGDIQWMMFVTILASYQRQKLICVSWSPPFVILTGLFCFLILTVPDVRWWHGSS